VVDLRVEDHDEPLVELRRLVRLHDAYALAAEGDELAGQGRHELAGEMFQKASALAPDNHELMFWAGLGAAQAGDLETGVARVRAAIAQQPGWLELLPRLTPQMAPGAAAILQRMSTA
jgi:Flp pilus assembly protein TadD